MFDRFHNQRKNRADLKSLGHSKGVTLLEVLIALLVLSVGLIGVAVLTVESMRNVHSSLLHSLASVAALDFEERLWIDLGTRTSGCAPDNDNGNLQADFVSHWGGENDQGNSTLFLPGFNMTTEAKTSNPEGLNFAVRTIDLDLVWNEKRFSAARFEGAGQTGEFVSFQITLPCRGT